MQEAAARWGANVAVGKCSIVYSDGRKPRLIVNSTVCGTNPSCSIPERYCLPTWNDVRASFPLRGASPDLSGFSIDIKAARKTVRVRESERGLLGLRDGDRAFFYRACPFGANFSAFWFQRVSAFVVRVSRLLLWIRHALMAYVVDFLLLQETSVIPLCATVMLAFFAASFGVPIPWKKLQLG